LGREGEIIIPPERYQNKGKLTPGKLRECKLYGGEGAF